MKVAFSGTRPLKTSCHYCYDFCWGCYDGDVFLKGGNALDIIHNVALRSSGNVDFSIENIICKPTGNASARSDLRMNAGNGVKKT